jgi:hypothetical protein
MWYRYVMLADIQALYLMAVLGSSQQDIRWQGTLFQNKEVIQPSFNAAPISDSRSWQDR